MCVCVSEEKERHKHGERNGDGEYVRMHVGVCESVCVYSLKEKERGEKKLGRENPSCPSARIY